MTLSYIYLTYSDVAQLVRASDSYPGGRQFNSARRYHFKAQNLSKYITHFKSFINNNKLFTHSDSLIVSFSGGVDSVVLVDLLTSSGYSDNLIIIHFNHLNRKENKKDEAFVRDFCNKRSLKYEIVKLEGLKKENFEFNARKKRYEYLKKASKGKKILLGHHIDDSFEWSLMQSFKSSHLKSSIGIPVVNGIIRRPLMCFSKGQILFYAKKYKLKYCFDPTNDNNDYERNFVRNKLIPLIKLNYPSYLKNYVTKAQSLASKENLLYTNQRSFKVIRQKNFSEIYSFDHCGDFAALDELIVSEVKRLSCSGRGSLREQIKKIKIALKNNKFGPLIISGGLRVYLNYNHIYISENSPTKKSSFESKKYSLYEFKKQLGQKAFFAEFVRVKNFNLPKMKRQVPFDVGSVGKITPLDLLRHWEKPQNVNKILDLAF